MAIDTNNKKLSLMEWDLVWEPGIPLLAGSFGQDDKQQLLWGYPGILWTEIVVSLTGLVCASISVFASVTGTTPSIDPSVEGTPSIDPSVTATKPTIVEC